MQITVFGASGKVGHLVVELALKRGHSVVAFVHHRDLFVPNNRLRVITGDIHSNEDVEKAILGSDAVISCLGSWGTKSRDILTAAMRAIIPVMEQQHISRIVTLTGSGAAAPGERTGAGHDALLKFLAPFPAGKVFSDGEQHMKLLAASNLDWTTVRSPVMKNRGGDDYTLRNQSGKLFDTINRNAVATALVDQVEATDFLRQAPGIFRK